MNIAKLQAQLQRVPDQALIGYVQSPDGQVPAYLALAELTRRKEIRQAGATQQASPTQTVAQQTVAQAEPGIAQLPVREDMFNEASYATGGIVAFQQGGMATAPAGIPQAQWNAMSDFEKSNYILNKRATVVPESRIGGDSLNAVLPGREKYLKKEAGITTIPTTVVRPDVITRPDVVTKPAVVPPLASTTVARPQADVVSAAPTVPATSPIGRVEYKTPTDFSAEYDTMMRPEISAQEAMAKYQGLMGTDVGRQKLNERLAAMETRAAKEEEQAPWMALAKAGLGMAGGRSQFAVQNIAEGAQAGLRDLSESRERLAAKEEKRFSIQSQLAQAERAEKVAAATYGLQSEEATKARNEANRLAKLGYKANLASDKAKGEFEASKANLNADLETAKIAEDTRYHDLWYKTNMEKTKRDAVTLEKSIMSNNTTQLKTLMSESGKLLKEMMDLGKDSSDPLYASTLRIYNGAADAMGLKAGIDTTPPVASLPPLDAKSASRYIKK
jgi:hypothetical protein